MLSGDDAGTNGVRRFEVFTGAGKRREWSPEVKAAIGAAAASAWPHALFAGSDEGGDNWAVIATLIECCKLNAGQPTRLADRNAHQARQRSPGQQRRQAHALDRRESKPPPTFLPTPHLVSQQLHAEPRATILVPW